MFSGFSSGRGTRGGGTQLAQLEALDYYHCEILRFGVRGCGFVSPDLQTFSLVGKKESHTGVLVLTVEEFSEGPCAELMGLYQKHHKMQ